MLDDIYQTIKQEIQGSSPTDTELFDRITSRLVAAGINIDVAATAKARTESPNVVAVFRGVDDSDELDYIEILGSEATIWGYNGEVQAELLTPGQIQHYYEDPPITPEDLAGLRCIERDGQKLYDEGDTNSLSERKTAKRKAHREGQRNLTLTLPDEFLKLCEEVNESPAAILEGFIADLCHLEERPYITNGSDERLFAEEYFDRCGYRTRAEWAREEAEKARGTVAGAMSL